MKFSDKAKALFFNVGLLFELKEVHSERDCPV